MGKNRLEAFSDGVLAIIITIMVLELKVPHGVDWSVLQSVIPVFASYVLSFVYVGIYWNNHHHLLHAAERVDGRVLWANLFFLFWLSLFPFVTSWVNEAEPMPASIPTAMYGVVLLMAAVAWMPLSYTLMRCNGGNNGVLGRALGGQRGDWKAKLSLAIYAAGIALALLAPIFSCILYALVAVLWIVPDRRIEYQLKQHP